MAKGRGKEKVSIILRREEVVEAGHHGGAWKVAYADFVTAMMAFFLLMWLLNATTEEQRKGLADYFSPKNPISRGSSGTGAPFGGSTPYDHGSLTSDRGAVAALEGHAPPEDDPEEQTDTPTEVRPRSQADSSTTAPADTTQGAVSPPAATEALHGRPATTADQGRPDQGRPDQGRPDQGRPDQGKPDQSKPAQTTAGQTAPGGAPAPAAAATPQPVTPPAAPPTTPTAAMAAKAQPTDSRETVERRERAAFDQAAEQLREAIRSDPALKDIARQLAVDITPEGLRIQIMDEDKQPMFATGSAALNDRAHLLLQKIAPVLLRLSEPVSIAGHTDATPYRGTDKTNWELSADRANATRRVLVEAGLPESRLRAVTGNADRDPLLPADPFAAANRRIAITVLRSAPQPAAPPAAVSSPAAPPATALPAGAPTGPGRVADVAPRRS